MFVIRAYSFVIGAQRLRRSESDEIVWFHGGGVVESWRNGVMESWRMGNGHEGPGSGVRSSESVELRAES